MKIMQKFLLTTTFLVVLFFIGNYCYYYWGLYIDLHPGREVTAGVTADEDTIYQIRDGKKVPFEIRGMNLCSSIPGKWATDFAIDRKTYERWFGMIQDLGCNTIRVYTVLSDDFYEAFYAYNQEHKENPLYLLHGINVNDYVMNSRLDAYAPEFQETLMDDCRTVVDIIHGNKNFKLGYGIGSGKYHKDISPWVLGYIIGSDWDAKTVAYTDHKLSEEKTGYQGEYLYTTPDATPFEQMLCETGDKMIAYESEKYKKQRLVSFVNTVDTDGLEHSKETQVHFGKCAKIDENHICSTEKLISGLFVSYHVYPFLPDYLKHEEGMWEVCTDTDGTYNKYESYLKRLTAHYRKPVVIAEYGLPSSRGMLQKNEFHDMHCGGITEEKQGEALIRCYQDIMDAGCAGSLLYSWQDEWYKLTWNTWHGVDSLKTTYWSDAQSANQFYGLLTFDGGKTETKCQTDGDFSEWTGKDLVFKDGDRSLSVKYDERYLYLYIKEKEAEKEGSVLYIPLDITPKSGSTYCENYDITMEAPADFLLVLDGKENSRLLVQERYNVLQAMFQHEIKGTDAYMEPPETDSPRFVPVELLLLNREEETADGTDTGSGRAETYETGKLHYGNSNPRAKDFDSLSDFCCGKDGVEIRLPWNLLNFSNPAEQRVHDDYYEVYGVENLKISGIRVGIGSAENRLGTRIPMKEYSLKGWKKGITCHERLKESYYAVKDYWEKQDREQVRENP